METAVAPELWFGTERIYPTPGGTCKGESLLTQPIHIRHVAGSGWKFEVVTGAEKADRHKVGEIITATQPADREPYASLLYMPTLLSSGLEAGVKIAANEAEFLFYLQALYKLRTELLQRWPRMRVSTREQERLELIIDEVRAGLARRQTELMKAAASRNPRIRDSKNRPNPSAASAGITAIMSRLEAQLVSEGRGAGSMRKRRVFAATLVDCYAQDIWDMRHFERYRRSNRERELRKRLQRAKIKPMLFAGLYAEREFEDNLGHPMVLPRILEVFASELQLMAIRDLFAGLEKHPDSHKETLHKLKVLLAISPEEQLYQEFFSELTELAIELGRNFRNDPDAVKKLAIAAKTRIRDRASDKPDHPWFVATNKVPRP